MLAPASLRPGPPPGGADRRRTVRLVVIAVIAAVLSVAIPLVLAGMAERDRDAVPIVAALTGEDPTGVAAATDDPGPAVAAAGAFGPVGVADPAPAAADPSEADPAGPTTATIPVAADPSLAAAASNLADAASSLAAAASSLGSMTPSSGATAVTAAAPVSAPANWMEALRPRVDPEGLATWVFQARGAWGASDGHTVYIDPDVPPDKRWSVMVHEYGHVLQVRRYGSLNATAAAMNDLVDANPLDKGPTESNADCIAELLGATWTDYGCQDPLRPAAAALVTDDGNRLAPAQAARP